MSRIGKACLLISGLFILASGVTRLVLGIWHDALYVSFGLALVALVIAIAKDYRTYIEFLTMRTTKHGMNMGALILLALVFLVSINFIAVRQNKKFDWTSEGLNSLSDQSVKAAKAIDGDLNVVLLVKKGEQEDSIRRNIQQMVEMYREKNPKIGFASYDARQRPDLASKFQFRSGNYGLFIEYKGKQQQVDLPMGSPEPTEEDLTKAFIKVARDVKKVVYFTQGRGERSLETGEQEPDGLSQLKTDLETLYTVKPLNLLETQKIPEDAGAVVIAGPTQQFLPTELELFRAFARSGGRLLIAGDPGVNHNLAQLTKSLGVEFHNNYVLDPRAQIPGMGNVAAIGMMFSKASDVTKAFQAGNAAVFELASAVTKAPDAPAGLKIDEIIKTDAVPRVANALTQDAIRNSAGGTPQVLAVAVDGKLPNAAVSPSGAAGANTSAPAESKEFAAVIFGDSDFMTNKMYRGYMNRDVVMNAVSYLAKDTEMISIRPKMPKGSTLELSAGKWYAILFGFLLPLPILMFASGGFIWYRRRTA